MSAWYNVVRVVRWEDLSLGPLGPTEPVAPTGPVGPMLPAGRRRIVSHGFEM